MPSDPNEPLPPRPPEDTGARRSEEVSADTGADPDFLGMAVSASLSMAKFAASGFRRVDPQTHITRLEGCQDCRHRDGKRCRLCGCFTDLKAWLPHEDCPVGKWTV